MFASGQKSADKFKKLNKTILLSPSFYFSGNSVAEKVFGRKIIQSGSSKKDANYKKRHVELIIPISVSPAVTKQFTVKSNNWMKLVFGQFAKPLYPE